MTISKVIAVFALVLIAGCLVLIAGCLVLIAGCHRLFAMTDHGVDSHNSIVNFSTIKAQYMV